MTKQEVIDALKDRLELAMQADPNVVDTDGYKEIEAKILELESETED